uniref:Ubiquitin-like domain-containing protein n=1 Tax=Chromera velia CCMP2878 TaxID=1169474 RepID=A0A0G4H9Q8_9ALVE|eukprot:Cvel_25361.t1-p1 / transcript=Cvel_25361.t1 / gene=Cvel_25361 / organism=Chromera_velia_CCMP2878 / gene_product=hypothetical protein / transcript_product=hypothetical protein / location=Cvel_scaffold2862:17821-19485(+) / protein_length=555 / sequence_SO=supercontig / SO=protein_coding / is_pseudo=false
MQLLVKTPTGSTLCVDVTSEDTVRCLMERVEERTKIPQAFLRLVVRGRLVERGEEGCRLSKLNVEAGMTVVVLVQKPPIVPCGRLEVQFDFFPSDICERLEKRLRRARLRVEIPKGEAATSLQARLREAFRDEFGKCGDAWGSGHLYISAPSGEVRSLFPSDIETAFVDEWFSLEAEKKKHFQNLEERGEGGSPLLGVLVTVSVARTGVYHLMGAVRDCERCDCEICDPPVVWQYCSGPRQWADMKRQASVFLEQEYRKREWKRVGGRHAVTLKDRKLLLSVDLETMRQTNVRTGRVRSIRRMETRHSPSPPLSMKIEKSEQPSFDSMETARQMAEQQDGRNSAVLSHEAALTLLDLALSSNPPLSLSETPSVRQEIEWAFLESATSHRSRLKGSKWCAPPVLQIIDMQPVGTSQNMQQAEHSRRTELMANFYQEIMKRIDSSSSVSGGDVEGESGGSGKDSREAQREAQRNGILTLRPPGGGPGLRLLAGSCWADRAKAAEETDAGEKAIEAFTDEAARNRWWCKAGQCRGLSTPIFSHQSAGDFAVCSEKVME